MDDLIAEDDDIQINDTGDEGNVGETDDRLVKGESDG